MKRIASLEDMETESLEPKLVLTSPMKKRTEKNWKRKHKKEEVKCRGRVSKPKEERER